ncbi:hypothetical protein [Myxosarcina sp. GI1]|nr:hypothetical protein [Myxosarcina sp. GI1]
MTEFKHSQNHNIPQWQSDKMRQMIIDRWQETWIVVEKRNKRLRRSSYH